MIKSELIQRLARKQPHLSHDDVDLAVTLLINKIVNGLASGDRIEIRGFGSFSLKHYKARIGRNPKTGDLISISQKHSVYFKPAIELKIRVDASSKNKD